MLIEFGIIHQSLLLLYTDSRNVQQTVLNKLNSVRTRHIDIKYKWVIEKIDKGKFILEHVGTEDMVADGLIKLLSKEKHTQFVKMLGLCIE